jgi:hypothetical protein
LIFSKKRRKLEISGKLITFATDFGVRRLCRGGRVKRESGARPEQTPLL